MSTAEPTDAEILTHVQRIWDEKKPTSPIYAFILSDARITHASKGLVRARLPLTRTHVTSKGGIHGTATACLIDWIGGMAIVSYDLRTQTGVSTDIHISYASSAKEGDVVEVEAKAGKVGGTLGFTTITICKVVDDEPGPLVASGSHTKFIKI